MRRRAKTETIRRREREQRRHDIARTAWSDEPMSVVQRLQAGLADLRSRLDAERLRLKPQPTLSFHLRKRIKATRDLIRLLEAERATMKDDAENRDRAPRASLDDQSGDDEETEPRASMSAGDGRRSRLCISAWAGLTLALWAPTGGGRISLDAQDGRDERLCSLAGRGWASAGRQSRKGSD
jgi:hypothetical protein